MNSLELKLPPVALVLLIALAMWGASLATPAVALPFAVRIVTAVVLVAAGMGISIAGVAAFRRARTTVNPTKPEATSSLVSSGIYGLMRNPMYLGFLLVLLGWAAFLSNAVALIGVFAYVFYMNRFQIAPEERALSAMFGAEFAAYKNRVRRWL
jgi:protein-S-isoprenylcysteine O-methyltransferase Ste14